MDSPAKLAAGRCDSEGASRASPEVHRASSSPGSASGKLRACLLDLALQRLRQHVCGNHTLQDAGKLLRGTFRDARSPTSSAGLPPHSQEDYSDYRPYGVL